MNRESLPRIRLAAVPDEWTLVVRGDELEPEVLTQDATRFYERYPDWNRFGVSAFLASTAQEIDALCQDRLVRFASVVVLAAGSLREAGVEIVPTFRSPHVTICHRSLAGLLEALRSCEYSLISNRHHIDEKGRQHGNG